MRLPTRAGGIVVAALIYGALASVAYGAKPTVVPADPSHSGVVTTICSFPVTVTSTTDGVIRTFTDAQGNVTRVQFQTTETDTFSANGNTIVGLPYPVRGTLLFDSEGNPTTVTGNGMIARMRLPDGSLFVSAGRFVSQGDPGFVLTPSVGHSGDVTALCAALA
jgi:hypothetical protein